MSTMLGRDSSAGPVAAGKITNIVAATRATNPLRDNKDSRGIDRSFMGRWSSVCHIAGAACFGGLHVTDRLSFGSSGRRSWG
jgi:hypothetical protein